MPTKQGKNVMITLSDLQKLLAEKQEQLLDLQYKLSDIEVNPQEYADLDSLHDDFLDEIYSEVCENLPVSVTGSELISEHDPVMYRCSFSEFCSDFAYQDLDVYQQTESEIEDLECEISDLEYQIEEWEEFEKVD
jgi:hypothetical protein